MQQAHPPWINGGQSVWQGMYRNRHLIQPLWYIQIQNLIQCFDVQSVMQNYTAREDTLHAPCIQHQSNHPSSHGCRCGGAREPSAATSAPSIAPGHVSRGNMPCGIIAAAEGNTKHGRALFCIKRYRVIFSY